MSGAWGSPSTAVAAPDLPKRRFTASLAVSGSRVKLQSHAILPTSGRSTSPWLGAAAPLVPRAAHTEAERNGRVSPNAWKPGHSDFRNASPWRPQGVAGGRCALRSSACRPSKHADRCAAPNASGQTCCISEWVRAHAPPGARRESRTFDPELRSECDAGAGYIGTGLGVQSVVAQLEFAEWVSARLRAFRRRKANTAPHFDQRMARRGRHRPPPSERSEARSHPCMAGKSALIRFRRGIEK